MSHGSETPDYCYKYTPTLLKMHNPYLSFYTARLIQLIENMYKIFLLALLQGKSVFNHFHTFYMSYVSSAWSLWLVVNMLVCCKACFIYGGFRVKPSHLKVYKSYTYTMLCIKGLNVLFNKSVKALYRNGAHYNKHNIRDTKSFLVII